MMKLSHQLKDKKIIAIIPARGGSKSIPKKNIIDLGEHPLIAYSIAVAQLSKFISRIIVSTDSEEIAEVSRSYGAEVPFLRPKEYAGDLSLDIEFFKHALDWLEKNEAYIPDLIVHLRPTTPLREYETIDKAILEVINDKQATALRSAHISEHTGYKIFRKKGDYINFFGQEDFEENQEYYNYCRQALPITYNPNGYIDIVFPKILKNTGTLHGSKIRAFIVKKIADIDIIKDVEFAEQLLKNKKYRDLINFLNKIKQS